MEGKSISAGVSRGDDSDGLGECRPSPSVDGFLGMDSGGEMGYGGEDVVGEDGAGIATVGLIGEPGRLANELVVGVLGVLDGRGPGSTGKIGKFLNIPASRLVSLSCSHSLSLSVRPFSLTDDRLRGEVPGTVNSSNSSILGKCCENSVKLYVDVCGE